MFCPNCRDEFRPGYTRCARCDVDLVEDLAQVPKAASAAPELPTPLRLTEYCGFLSLAEAREARDRLRGRWIRSEIVVREAPEAPLDQPVREEYWLRVDITRLSDAQAIIGEIPVADEGTEPQGEGFACGECGHRVGEDETFCPGCGARFD